MTLWGGTTLCGERTGCFASMRRRAAEADGSEQPGLHRRPLQASTPWPSEIEPPPPLANAESAAHAAEARTRCQSRARHVAPRRWAGPLLARACAGSTRGPMRFDAARPISPKVDRAQPHVGPRSAQATLWASGVTPRSTTCRPESTCFGPIVSTCQSRPHFGSRWTTLADRAAPMSAKPDLGSATFGLNLGLIGQTS